MNQQLPVQMHPKYQEFLKFMADCPYRKTPECMQTAFWVWLELTKVQEFFNSRPDPRNEEVTELKTKLGDYIEESTKTIQMLSIDKKLMKGELDSLKNDLDRLHRERDSFQEQARCLAESSDTITDYAIFQAISDLERVCRHRTATQSEDWLQIESEDRTTKPVIKAALIALEAANVELKRREKFPNVLIVYDRGKNEFFGRN